MTPAGAEAMVQNQHQLLVEKDAGIGSGFTDTNYLSA
jgi:alanine dehydrogenase